MIRYVLTALMALMLNVGVWAQDSAPDPASLSPEAIELEAREIGRSLRCVVCQNQSIEESDAPLASDMRDLVRERLAAGDDAEAIREYMRDRYGDFVLLKPPVQPNTYILWYAPFVLLGLLLIWWFRASRRRLVELDEAGSEDIKKEP